MCPAPSTIRSTLPGMAAFRRSALRLRTTLSPAPATMATGMRRPS
jgi:hypothetical protein